MQISIMKKAIWLGVLSVIIFVFFTMAVTNNARANTTSPEGTWRIVYDGKDEVQYKLWLQNGTLFGKIHFMNFTSGPEPDPSLKNMTILSGLTQNEKGEWTSGKVFDPESGKHYKCKITLKDGGSKLVLKGYAGVFSSSETWSRVN